MLKAILMLFAVALHAQVRWSIEPPVGTITADGVYTAPSSVAVKMRVTVKATSMIDPANFATVPIDLKASAPLAVPLQPAALALDPGAVQRFTALGIGTPTLPPIVPLPVPIGGVSSNVPGPTGALTIDATRTPAVIDITAAVPLKAGANTWTGANDYSRAAKTAPFRIGTSDPVFCDPVSREFFFNTTTNTLRVCTSANIWTAVR